MAITARALQVFGQGLIEGYDIGCTFQKTIASSSLGDIAKAMGLRCCVNAFHGYSHNQVCQTINHPNIIEGTGIEDFETMERIFGGSNLLAPVTWYATAYRRRVLIDQYFRQWDEEKYLNLGLWLYKNYVQSLKIIREEGFALEEGMKALNIQSVEQLDEWHKTQVSYFAQLGKEPEWDVHAVAYVERLKEMREIEYVLHIFLRYSCN